MAIAAKRDSGSVGVADEAATESFPGINYRREHAACCERTTGADFADRIGKQRRPTLREVEGLHAMASNSPLYPVLRERGWVRRVGSL